MKIIKNIFLWFLVISFLIMAVGSGGVSSLFALIPIALLIPIKKWQNLITKIINNKIKIIAVVLCFILMIAFFPTTETIDDANLDTEVSDVIIDDIETTSLTTENSKSTTSKETKPITTNKATTETTVESKTTTKDSVTTTKNNANETTIKNTNTTTTKKDNKETTRVVSITTTVHVHTFIAATCSSPKICSECGVTEGTANGHDYWNGVCNSCGEEQPGYSNEDMVWIPTRGGSKYHSKSTCSGMIDPEYVTKNEAINRGFGPCGRCY